MPIRMSPDNVEFAQDSALQITDKIYNIYGLENAIRT